MLDRDVPCQLLKLAQIKTLVQFKPSQTLLREINVLKVST